MIKAVITDRGAVFDLAPQCGSVGGFYVLFFIRMPERSSQQDGHIHPFALRVPFAKSLILFRSGRYGMDGAQGKSAGVPIPDSQPCRRYPFKREHMRLRLGVCPSCCQFPHFPAPGGCHD